MDFLKSLLLYMTLTLASSVQGAEMPEATPLPTPSAAVITVETTLGAPSTVTPVPQPTITPNRSYQTLSFGSRGSEVRKLQKRLQELGYLAGNIDGAYGYETRSAVSRFQKANGLRADGDAGPATLTILYQSASVVPNPAVVSPTPVPTATPDAYGLIPQPEDPSALWTARTGASVLMDGEALQAIMRSENGSMVQSSPHVWHRGTQVIVCVSEIAAASDAWTLTSASASACTLSASGYTVELTMTEQAAAARKDDQAYCENYAAVVNGTAMTLANGDWMFLNGRWYATGDFLTSVLNAQIAWDQEENTLLITVLPAELVGATD